MTKTMRGRVLAAALLLMPVTPAFAQQTAPPAYGQPPQPFAWWKSEPFRKELGLTTDRRRESTRSGKRPGRSCGRSGTSCRGSRPSCRG